MEPRTGPARDFGQDDELGRLVETRLADPDGRWSRVAAVHDALEAAGAKVVTVESGVPEGGTEPEVRVLADRLVTDLLTAMVLPPSSEEELAARIDAAADLDELKAIMKASLIPKRAS